MTTQEKEIKYWLISDTHFSHLKLEEWNLRSGNWQEQMWNGLELLQKDNIFIHLGDICIGDDLEVHERLSKILCKKILVKGNHDKKSNSWYLRHGWDFVCDSFDLIYRGHYLHFSHTPARPSGNTTWNIHGHSHGNLHRSEESIDFYSEEYHIDISPEIKGFKPISLDSLLKK